jgi:hypothetical protein
VPQKQFYLPADQIKPVAKGHGACIATDMITVDRQPVGYMYREEAMNDVDGGWRFFSGNESQEYVDNAENSSFHDVNTIANYDPEIIPYLHAPIGCEFERDPASGGFVQIKGPTDREASLNPDFPIVEGEYGITDHWSVNLPRKFNRRVEDGDLIIWRPMFTMYLTVWNNDNNQSEAERLSWLKSEMSQVAFAIQESDDGDIIRLGYRLTEDHDGAAVNAWYGFAIADNGHVQMAIYFDDESDLELAQAVWRSVALHNVT